MEVIHVAQMPWGESLVAQRGGGDVAHRRIFEGEEGSPDNYMLVMSQEPKSFLSPRHRHPWDQIRICLEGKIPIAKGLFVESGEIAYFPESAYYGPQQGGEDRIVLLLQFGGASGQGFIGPDRVNEARLALAKEGRFEDGIYIRDTMEGRRNRDAYEAIWLRIMGTTPCYAAPAYKTPIVMLSEALSWLPTSEAGISVKRMGVFPHRGLSINAWRIEPDSVMRIPASGSLRLFFVTDGEGRAGREETRRWSAIRLQGSESMELRAADHLELIEMAVRPVSDLKSPSPICG